MRRWVVLFGLLASAAVAGQERTFALDKAYEEARAAHNALKTAEAQRDAGVESRPGERIGSASGASRPTENYFARQAILEQQVELARQRYEAAMKRWNDLK